MAEFQEVMRQWRRMCEKHTCYNRVKSEILPLCPLFTKHHGYPCDDSVTDLSQESVAQVEEIVMAWAAEHPEPVYETWLEFIKRFETGKPKSDNDFIYWMGTTSIPADIAQKLGIEPKEGWICF